MKKIILLFIMICCNSLFSQKLDFSDINSTNILRILNVESTNKTAVVQLGDRNTANIYDRSRKSDLLIRQTGDYNTTRMTNTNPELENKQKISVQGNNNYIDVTGNNSNSKEMEINLKTNDKMIFIRHY